METSDAQTNAPELQGAVKVTTERRSWRGRLRPYGKNSLVFSAAFGLVVAAQAALTWAPAFGVYVNAAAIVGLILLALTSNVIRKTAISLAIIPLVNMVVASIMPLDIVNAALIADDGFLLLAVIYRYLFSLDAPHESTHLPLRSYLIFIPAMIVLGEVFGTLGFALLGHYYVFMHYPLPLVAGAVVVFALAEETLLRGLIQHQAARIVHPLVAALGTTILFVLLALDTRTLLSLPVALLLGAMLALIYAQKQNLALTITINAVSKLTYLGLVATFILR